MKKIVFLLLISTFLITGCSIKKTEEVTDSEIFASEYAISKDNVFKYVSINEVFNLLESGSGIIFFGNSDQERCSDIVKLLSDLLEKSEIKEVYYYNPLMIRDNNTDDYDKLTTLLGDDLAITADGDSFLNIPSVYFVRDGVIVGYNDDAANLMELDEEELKKFEDSLKNKYLKLIEKYLNDNTLEDEK